MISIHIVSLIIGLIIGLIAGGAIPIMIDKSLFFDERYLAGWGKGYQACNEIKKDKD